MKIKAVGVLVQKLMIRYNYRIPGHIGLGFVLGSELMLGF